MLPHHRFHCADSLDYMLYQYVKRGQEREAREALTSICRKRRLTSVQMKELLRAAVLTDQKSILKLILDQGPVLGKQSPKELSALWIAVLCDYHNSAELLVRSGADVNELLGAHSFYDEKSCVLHVLLMKSPSTWNERFIALVTDSGADLKARDSEGRTVLHYAVSMSRVTATELFLERGADVNAADNNGETPLLDAVYTNEAAELLPLLMRHGADFAAKDMIGKNALHRLAATSVEHVDLARIFIQKAVSLEARESRKQFQPIHLAALNGKNEMVKLFLDHGADVDSRGSRGTFPLYLAAKSKRPEALETLLKRGAKIESRTGRGRTALHSACDSRQEKNVMLLLAAGADMLAEDNDGNTPFALIEYKNMNPCVLLMLKELALMKARRPAIELKDERIIRQYPKLWKFYQECIEEIGMMKSERFIKSCTFFELVTKNHYQIAALMRNPEFEANFKQCDLNGFSKYPEHIIRAFERAEYCYHFMLEQEDFISQAVCEILPHMVVRRIVHYLCPKYVFNECWDSVE